MLKIAKYSKHEAIFLSSIVISTLGDSMIPIAFALSAVELENSGYGFTAVLLSLGCTSFRVSAVPQVR